MDTRHTYTHGYARATRAMCLARTLEYLGPRSPRYTKPLAHAMIHQIKGTPLASVLYTHFVQLYYYSPTKLTHVAGAKGSADVNAQQHHGNQAHKRAQVRESDERNVPSPVVEIYEP